MTELERDWLVAERPRPIALTDDASEHARTALLQHMTPTPAPRRRHRRQLIALGATVAVAGTVLALVPSSPPPPTAPRAQVKRPPTVPSLALVAYKVRAQPRPAGDATLVIRHQAYPGQDTITVADLYADDGRYFFAKTKGGLAAEVAANDDRADGLFAREIAAARYAATGDLDTARERMAGAVFAHPEAHPKPRSRDLADNYVWGNSYDALGASAGDPEVRAGVLRLLSTIASVKVSDTTTDGHATLTLDNEGERLVLDATTGIPLLFIGGDPANPTAKITYDVTRLELADL